MNRIVELSHEYSKVNPTSNSLALMKKIMQHACIVIHVEVEKHRQW